MPARRVATEEPPRFRVVLAIANAFGVSPQEIQVREKQRPSDPQLWLQLPDRALRINVLSRGVSSKILDQWQALQRHATRRTVPVIAVPTLSASAQSWCAAQGINWIDFSGNAHIRAPGLFVRVSGSPQPYAKRGRPSSVFERRSSRVARALLQHPGRAWSVKECAQVTGLDEGHVSRIVARLVEDRLVTREAQRHFLVKDAELLLDTWRDASDFSKHRILRGHVAARSGFELLEQLVKRLDRAKLEHAATGLGAAWLYDHFAMFRLATLYVRQWPTSAHLEALHLREEPVGANVWLVLPNDDGVFEGARVVESITCVHPVQVYLDLKAHPERAPEAADHLRENRALLGLDHGA
jgi:AraC-like DNA-binding protein